MEYLSEDLKKKIAAHVRRELEGDMIMHHENPQVTIELLDRGMIVHYSEPEKRMRAPSISKDPLSQMLLTMLPKIVENIMGGDEEDWSEEKRSQREMMKMAMEKVNEQMSPKPREEWYWATKSVVVLDPKDLSVILEQARAATKKAKELQADGKYIMGFPGSGYAVAAYAGEPFASPVVPGMPPVSPVTPSDLA